VGLNLYRRHRRACKANRAQNHCSGEFEERRKGWKQCDCPIFASGTLDGAFKRKSTGVWNWENARAIARLWESEDSWDGLPAKAPAPPTTPAPASTVDPEPEVKISKAIADYLADHKGDSAKSTMRMYGYLLKSFAAYSEELGYLWINQWRPEDVRAFRNRWKVRANTKRKNLSNLKAFFEYCLEDRWIRFNPARFKLRRTQSGSNTSERLPFSDDDLKRMFQACAMQYGQGKYAYRYRWSGQDLSDFIAISTYTGLRISDVATFRASRLQKNGECFIRAFKNKKKVSTWIPTWLQDRIQARAKEFGDLIFGAHETKDIESICDQWRRKLNRLWKMCGPWSSPPVHHRFRHTFARIMLEQDDVGVRDVAELLGDTEEMVREHYAAWVTERQERLTGVVRRAFEGKPMPVAMTSQRSQL
jgi:integrase